MAVRFKAKFYQIGDLVHSVAVGARAEFEGVIVDQHSQYVVRDDAGKEWCRTAGELWLVTAAGNSHG